ncbi:FkbM family methyltransferase [Hoeflea ulvae]|uniref:FkbM family methyltransferase n=1 Tax=Hoeflea ulvae TaxID=2983764 RepID=A0ABT3YKI3_9HYPH|nr:FkbM family methyltransferase [Hoeflea ulvae]MCY0096406.1 FkbM family methyltransferase [Hoeflea ulvae]
MDVKEIAMPQADLFGDDLRLISDRCADENLPGLQRLLEVYLPHSDEISRSLYTRLPVDDRPDFLAFLARRWAGFDLVPDSRLRAYDATIAEARAQPASAVTVAGQRYLRRNFAAQGADIDLIGYEAALCVHTIGLDQYRHRDFSVAPGDIVIDGGAFIGDTAVYFHHVTGRQCQIHSFELLSENAALFEANRQLNRISSDEMVLNRLALSDRSGETMRIANTSAPAAARASTNDAGEAIQTISIDDYVESRNLDRVDVIKLDLEGGDVPALAGARATIRRFRPKLALCLYHRWDDILAIPALIHASGVDYRFVFKWVHLRAGWEAILMCTPVSPAIPSAEIDQSSLRD